MEARCFASSVRLRPNYFRSDRVAIRPLSRLLTPPLNLVRLSVIMPFAGIGPRLIFHGARLYCSRGDPPPHQSVAAILATEPYCADAYPLRDSSLLSPTIIPYK